MLSESTLRRPEFAGGTPLLLPDGQAWWFYAPVPSTTRLGAWEWGNIPEDATVALTDALYITLCRLSAATDASERATHALTLAWLCLARNYEVSPDQFTAIMTASPGSTGLWSRIGRMAREIEAATVSAVMGGGDHG